MRILLSRVVSRDAERPTCLNPPMAVTRTHCSPSSFGLAMRLATEVSISWRSSWLTLRYPLTSETVLDGIGGARMTLTFHPDCLRRSASSLPSFPTTSDGLIASTRASPVSSRKLMSKMSAFSGIMERIISSTFAGSSSPAGSGRMSTLRCIVCATVLATESLAESFSYSSVYTTTSGPSNLMSLMLTSGGIARLTSSLRESKSLSTFM